jgi:hypothetical protein
VGKKMGPSPLHVPRKLLDMDFPPSRIKIWRDRTHLAARSIARPVSRRLPLSGRCALQTFDIQLFHLHHGLKGPLGFCAVGVIEQLRQDLGDNLPGETKLIL